MENPLHSDNIEIKGGLFSSLVDLQNKCFEWNIDKINNNYINFLYKRICIGLNMKKKTPL